MQRLRDLAVSIAIALAVLATVEVGLRVAGFRRDFVPMSLRFGYPNPREIVDVFRPDPALFWRMRPGSVFDAEAPVPINAAGYRGPVAAGTPAPGLARVAVMGDSVAFGASTAFPEMLASRLGESMSRPVEVLNFGVPGYSIVQGLRQFDAEAAPLSPAVVVIAYGWNDHWLARGGLADEDRGPSAGAIPPVARFLNRFRITQALHVAADRITPARGAGPGPGGIRRVPLERFHALVAAYVDHARAAGAVPIVVALPSALGSGEFPEYLTAMGFAASASEAIADHAAYAAAARDAATAAGARFVDLQPAFEEAGAVVPGLFRADKIHMTDAGNARIAEALAPVVAAACPGAA